MAVPGTTKLVIYQTVAGATLQLSQQCPSDMTLNSLGRAIKMWLGASDSQTLWGRLGTLCPKFCNDRLPHLFLPQEMTLGCGSDRQQMMVMPDFTECSPGVSLPLKAEG